MYQIDTAQLSANKKRCLSLAVLFIFYSLNRMQWENNHLSKAKEKGTFEKLHATTNETNA